MKGRIGHTSVLPNVQLPNIDLDLVEVDGRTVEGIGGVVSVHDEDLQIVVVLVHPQGRYPEKHDVGQQKCWVILGQVGQTCRVAGS